MELKEKLEKLGIKNVSGDSALFTFHKDGKLEGIVCLHVDDLLMAGSKTFKNSFLHKITENFSFRKWKLTNLNIWGAK